MTELQPKQDIPCRVGVGGGGGLGGDCDEVWRGEMSRKDQTGKLVQEQIAVMLSACSGSTNRTQESSETLRRSTCCVFLPERF